MEECSCNDRMIRRDSSLLQTGYDPHQITDKIVEVDSWKPDPSSNMGSKRIKPQKPISCQSMGRVPSSLSLLDHSPFEAAVYSSTADNSPKAFPSSTRPGSSSSSSRRQSTMALTPRSTDCSTNSCSDHPKYMAKTQSSQAKVRSQSAPRMRRLDFHKPTSSKRSFHGCWDPSSSPNKSIVNKGRPGSAPGCLDRVGSSTTRLLR